MNVLVIIDNIFQYDKIKHIVEKNNKPNTKFDFRHSPNKSQIWDHLDFRNKEKSIIDVKKQVEFIIDNYELVISVHCFQFFPKKLVDSVRCINIHPGYNPINRGWYPQVFAIINDLPIGATIHEMDEKLDNGKIIAREFVEKHTWDTSLTLYNRVLDMEIQLFDKYFNGILDNKYESIEPENEGNIFLKSDFNELIELDLNKEGTFKDFYDTIRALSHGDYKNASFIDKKSGKQIYIKLDISID
jgi:dTDP-4-amino-4,6-dideoxyglucose formyltransferase